LRGGGGATAKLAVVPDASFVIPAQAGIHSSLSFPARSGISKCISLFVVSILAFISLTSITFPTQQAQAFTAPICGPTSGTGVYTITATTVTYGGKKFDIIGYNKNNNQVGVAGPNNSVTLLLDRDTTYTKDAWNPLVNENIYTDSTVSNTMVTFAYSILTTNDGIIERTLTGGSTNQGTGGYIEDYVAGSNVINQKAWLLSVDEASHLTLLTRRYPSYWWLRTPGNSAIKVAEVILDGTVNPVGLEVNISAPARAIRPALYLNISNSALSGLNFDNNNLPIGACTREPTNLGIDFNAETITGLDTATEGWKIGATYAGLGAFTPQVSTSTNIAGTITSSTKSLVFVKASDDIDHFDSNKDRNGVAQQSLATTINIPARPAGPSGLSGVAPSDVGASDGKITGTSNKMEYSTDEVTWTSVTGAAITGLTSGTYFVRTIADQSTSKFKSFATEVIVKEGSSSSSGPGSGPSSGQPGSGTGPSAGDGGFSSEGTAQTGVDFAGLELLIVMMLVGTVVLRRPVTGIIQPEIATLRSQ
jgi:hypothetical protein